MSSTVQTYSQPTQDKGTAPPGWEISGPNEISRPFDLLEEWFHRIVGGGNLTRERDSFGSNYVAKLKFPDSVKDPVPYVRRAWLLTRYLHPQLGATYSSDTPDVKYTIRPLDPENWLKTTFFVEQGPSATYKSAEDAVAQFPSKPTITAHWIPATSELLMRATHLQIEGIGFSQLTHSFVTSLTSILRHGLDLDLSAYPSNVKVPTPSPGVSIGAETFSYADAPDYIKKGVDRFITQLQQGQPGIALPMRAGAETAAPTDTRRLVFKLDETLSADVRKACVKNKVSVAAAIHTALVRVTASYPQDSATKDLLIVLTANMRRFLFGPDQPPELAVGLYSTAVSYCIPGGLDPQIKFVDLARKVGEKYATDLSDVVRDDEGKPVSFLTMLSPWIDRYTQVVSGLSFGSPMFRSPAVSSLGLMEKLVQRSYSFGDNEKDQVEVEDLWWSVDVLDQGAYFHISTFRGKLRLQVCFNQSYYTEAFVSEVIQKIMDELVQGLGISSQAKL
ncbi:Loline biosynthesis cluster 1 transcription factor lolU1 [Paramyrothecium foliicola]|nr:Loline biosynthesis cluster 1 transcription factor lolU1 [Paramyrothecium foliicola]